ncbi:hypothetical protein [Streptomyces sp.]|uniref:hypothetical protein n=1 Tax=Streptomyces sp. TaxID=1931 RepID=UPI002F420629
MALGERPGWYGVFAEREPVAAQAYQNGMDIPPWDVVRAALHDLAAGRGVTVDDGEVARVQALHRAATAAWDAAPGAEHALRARLDAALRARDLAVLHEREVMRAYDHAAASAPVPADARLANVLAWARDDRERAVARCAELHARLAALTSGSVRPREGGPPVTEPVRAERPWGGAGDPAAPGNEPRPAQDGGPAPSEPVRAERPRRGAGDPAVPAHDPSPDGRSDQPAPGRAASWGARGGKGRGGARPRGARFAGAYDDADEAPLPPVTPAEPGPGPSPRGARFAGAQARSRGARFAGAPEAAEPVLPAVPAAETVEASPRGARFAGAQAVEAPPPRPRFTDPRWTAEARAEAARLGELRRAGQTGAAYVVLCEAAEGPPDRLPYLVRELELTGLAADVATLLWETAALPPASLAAAAGALAAEDRAAECRTLLHQAAARPANDIAEVADVLTAAGRRAEAGELLATVVRARPAEDAAEVVRVRPALAGPLVAAAERVSKSRRRDIVVALRRAGQSSA